MTYTVMGRCGETGQIGMGLTTTSLAVGGLCPFITGNGDLVSSQAYAQPKVGLEAVRLLNAGSSLEEMRQRLEKFDPFFSYRQVGVLRQSGEALVHTGPNCRPWAGHRIGRNYLVMGNVLSGEKVVAAMAEAFEKTDASLADRLLITLEAGRDAGGQATPDGKRCAERSGALLVLGDQCYRELDLRVDVHPRAMDELRRLFDIFKPYNPYNKLRAETPPDTPPLWEWEAENLKSNPPPPVLV